MIIQIKVIGGSQWREKEPLGKVRLELKTVSPELMGFSGECYEKMYLVSTVPGCY